ncbi:hypothetical protein [Streptomyces sp. NPDC005486]|uniref:SCO2400 family protein n=1 Tax=Streptomyces sp. NPDC005486 TaxID=3155345 RepID=UPI0033A0FFBF
MDYCHPCRRHLNGALACPGCGAPAPQLRAYPPAAYEPEPPAAYEPGPYAPEPGPYVPDASAHGTPDGSDRGGGDEHSDSDDYADHGNYGNYGNPGDHDGHDDHDGHSDRSDHGDHGDREGSDDREGGSVEPQGRAARRREQGRGDRRGPKGAASAPDASRRDRKASVHRRRRKRVVLISVGFALAAAGLSLAELGVDAPGFGSPRNPAAAGGESSEVDGSAAERSASAQPLDDRTGTGGDKASSSPSPSASPSASPSESPTDGTATPAPDKEAQSAPLPGSSGPASGSTPSGSGSTPTADPTPTGASPAPSPSETCERFLWWCS